MGTCLTVDELTLIWTADSSVTNWNQVRDSFPDAALDLMVLEQILVHLTFLMKKLLERLEEIRLHSIRR